MNDDWKCISEAPEGVVLETRISDEHGERNIATLIKRGRLWYTMDESMYVYYTPTHFREVSK